MCNKVLYIYVNLLSHVETVIFCVLLLNFM